MVTSGWSSNISPLFENVKSYIEWKAAVMYFSWFMCWRKLLLLTSLSFLNNSFFPTRYFRSVSYVQSFFAHIYDSFKKAFRKTFFLISFDIQEMSYSHGVFPHCFKWWNLILYIFPGFGLDGLFIHQFSWCSPGIVWFFFLLPHAARFCLLLLFTSIILFNAPTASPLLSSKDDNPNFSCLSLVQ